MGFFSNILNSNSKKSNLEKVRLVYESTFIEKQMDDDFYANKAQEIFEIVKSLEQCKGIEHFEFQFWKTQLYCYAGRLGQRANNFDVMNDYFQATIIELESLEKDVPFFYLYPESQIALDFKKYTSDVMYSLSEVRSFFASFLIHWGEDDLAEEVIIDNIKQSKENFKEQPLTANMLAFAYEQAFIFYQKTDSSKSNDYAKKGFKVLEFGTNLEAEMHSEDHSLFRFKYNYMIQQRYYDRSEAEKLEKELSLFADLKDFKLLANLVAPPIIILELNPKANLLQTEFLDKFNQMAELGKLYFQIFEGRIEKPGDMEKDLTHYFSDNIIFGTKLLKSISVKNSGISKIEATYWEGHLHMYLANIDTLIEHRSSNAIEHFELAIKLFLNLDKSHKIFRYYEASPIHLDVVRFSNDRLFHLAEARRIYAGFLTQLGEFIKAEKVIMENIDQCEKHYKKDDKTFYSLAETYHQAYKFFWTEDLDKSHSYVLKAINLFERNKDLEAYIDEGDFTPLEANWSYLVILEKMDADESIVMNQSDKVSLYIDDVNDSQAVATLFNIQRQDMILPKPISD